MGHGAVGLRSHGCDSWRGEESVGAAAVQWEDRCTPVPLRSFPGFCCSVERLFFCGPLWLSIPWVRLVARSGECGGHCSAVGGQMHAGSTPKLSRLLLQCGAALLLRNPPVTSRIATVSNFLK